MKDWRDSFFIGDLVTKPSPGTDGGRSLWQLVDDFGFWSTRTNSIYTVPAGFVTDFASVPRVPLVYWLMNDRGQRAAVIHDFLCRTGVVPRPVADRIFRDALVVEGVSKWRAALMYAAVRVGGASRPVDMETLEQ